MFGQQSDTDFFFGGGDDLLDAKTQSFEAQSYLMTRETQTLVNTIK